MRYSPRIYAAALSEALDKKSDKAQKQIAKRLLRIVYKNCDKQKLGHILKETEKIILEKSNTAKIRLESAESVPAKLKHEIKRIINKNILFSEKINPAVLAGIKILINDEILIDATAQTRLTKLFSA